MTPVWHELLTMVTLAVGGIGGAWLLGARKCHQLIVLGALIAVGWRVISLVLLDAIGLRPISFEVWAAVLLVLFAVAIGFGFRKLTFWVAVLIAKLLALGAVTLTRMLQLAGRPHSDSNWILVMSDAVQSGQTDLSALGGRTAIKRGFAYPLLLALGPDGQHLTAVTPYLWLVLIIAIWWLASESLAGISARKARILIAGSSLVLLTATLSGILPLRALLYVNGHTLFGVAATAAVAASIAAIQAQRLKPHLLATVTLAFATISITRPEGIVFAAILALPLLQQQWIRRWQVAVIVNSATLALALWFIATDWVLLQRLGLFNWLLGVLLLASGVAFATRQFDWLRKRLLKISSWLALAFVLVVTLWFNVELIPGLASLWQNLGPANEGLWGYFPLAFLPVLALIGWRGLSQTYRLLASTSLLLIFATLATKVLDGAQVLEISLGRVGWTDSVNRMWIHSFGIFFATVLVGLVERGTQVFKLQATGDRAKDSIPK